MCAGSAIAGTSSSSQSPRDNEFETDNPKGPSVAPDKGIYIFVNGAGGDGHYTQEGFLGLGVSGTKPDIFSDDDNFCVTRIDLLNAMSADVDVLDFGTSARKDPTAVAKSLVKIRL